jgi:hypothetical protein
MKALIEEVNRQRINVNKQRVFVKLRNKIAQ